MPVSHNGLRSGYVAILPIVVTDSQQRAGANSVTHGEDGWVVHEVSGGGSYR